MENSIVFYVGKTRNIYRRMKEHRQALGYWPEFCILESGTTFAWWIAERKWIRKLHPQLKNISPGGHGRDFLPESSRRKISLANKGRPKPPSFLRKLKRNWRLGIYAERIVAKNAGQFRKGQKSAFAGYRHHEKTKLILSEISSKNLIGNKRRLGIPFTPEQRARLSEIGKRNPNGNPKLMAQRAKMFWSNLKGKKRKLFLAHREAARQKALNS